MSDVVLRVSLPFFVDSETIEDSAILSSNSTMRQAYINKLASYLAPVLQSGSTGWRKCYQATVHGWDTKNFHFRCNYKGPTVTIVRFGKYIFGAYASVSWQGKLTGENHWWCLSETEFNDVELQSMKKEQQQHQEQSKTEKNYCRNKKGPVI